MKVVKSEDNLLVFDNGLTVIGEGVNDCCAINYLDFEQLPVGTVIPDMTGGMFVEAITVKDDGFSIKTSDGVPKWVQARSEQNGYYSNLTTLIVEDAGGLRVAVVKQFNGMGSE